MKILHTGNGITNADERMVRIVKSPPRWETRRSGTPGGIANAYTHTISIANADERRERIAALQMPTLTTSALQMPMNGVEIYSKKSIVFSPMMVRNVFLSSTYWINKSCSAI